MKLFKIKLPTGQNASVGELPSYALGVMFLIIAFATGQALTRKIAPTVQRVPFADATLEPLTTAPVATKGKRVY